MGTRYTWTHSIILKTNNPLLPKSKLGSSFNPLGLIYYIGYGGPATQGGVGGGGRKPTSTRFRNIPAQSLTQYLRHTCRPVHSLQLQLLGGYATECPKFLCLTMVGHKTTHKFTWNIASMWVFIRIGFFSCSTHFSGYKSSILLFSQYRKSWLIYCKFYIKWADNFFDNQYTEWFCE